MSLQLDLLILVMFVAEVIISQNTFFSVVVSSYATVASFFHFCCFKMKRKEEWGNEYYGDSICSMSLALYT